MLQKVLDQSQIFYKQGTLYFFLHRQHSTLNVENGHILRNWEGLLMKINPSYILHNHFKVFMVCNHESLSRPFYNNIHICHNDNFLLFLLLCIFHIYRNDIFSFSYIHHQKICKLHKSSLQSIVHKIHILVKPMIIKVCLRKLFHYFLLGSTF